ncbi:PCRF domain-containing protein [Phthorimaea operculella]|nr:PCRF domain-containing protein [Phthorimaea operculella]
MYRSYGKFKNWRVDVASTEEYETGLKRASVLIEGLGALELMSIEKGVHHRVSDIAQPNRISTVTVSVLQQPLKAEMDVPLEDLIIETKAENDEDVNSQNYVRVTHTPTGLSLTCKTSRSNKANKYIAMKELNTLLFNKTKIKDQSEEKGDGVLIQSSRIIRTYDFIRDRVMEHRDEESQLCLTSFLEGGEDLEQLQETLLNRQHHQELLEEISKFKKKHEDDVEGEAYTPGSM